jgi:hypothetical protein
MRLVWHIDIDIDACHLSSPIPELHSSARPPAASATHHSRQLRLPGNSWGIWGQSQLKTPVAAAMHAFIVVLVVRLRSCRMLAARIDPQIIVFRFWGWVLCFACFPSVPLSDGVRIRWEIH